MDTAIGFVIAFAPWICAGVVPFIRVLRGYPVGKAFKLCWGLLILFFLIWSLVIPSIIYHFDKDMGSEAFFHWVPESTGFVPVVVFGWAYAGITVLPAWLIRLVFEYFQPPQSVSATEAILPSNGVDGQSN